MREPSKTVGPHERSHESESRPLRLLRAAVLWAVLVVLVAAMIAAATRSFSWLPRAVMSVYFPPFFVTGTPDGRLIFVVLFLLLAAFLLYRRKYWAALATLILPIAATWIFAWRLMGG